MVVVRREEDGLLASTGSRADRRPSTLAVSFLDVVLVKAREIVTPSGTGLKARISARLEARRGPGRQGAASSS